MFEENGIELKEMTNDEFVEWTNSFEFFFSKFKSKHVSKRWNKN